MPLPRPTNAGASKQGGDNTKMLMAAGACVLIAVAIFLVVFFLYKKGPKEGEATSGIPTAALPVNGYVTGIPVMLTPTQTPTLAPTLAPTPTPPSPPPPSPTELAAMEAQSAPGMSPDASLMQLARNGPKFRKKPCGDAGRAAFLITDGSNFLSDQGGLLTWSPNATCWTVEKAGCGTGYVRLRSPSGTYLRKLSGSNVLALVSRIADNTPDGCWKL